MTKQSNYTILTAANDNPGGATTATYPLAGMIRVMAKAFVSAHASTNEPSDDIGIGASTIIDNDNRISRPGALPAKSELSRVQY